MSFEDNLKIAVEIGYTSINLHGKVLIHYE